MVAPGAEEFLATTTPGPWLPPERTFAPLRGGDRCVPRRARAVVELAFEHEFGAAFVLGIGRFHQSVDDQLVTLFGLQMPGGPQSVGPLLRRQRRLGGCGRLGVRLEQPSDRPDPGSVDYTVTRAQVGGRRRHGRTAADRAGGDPGRREDIHDITTLDQGGHPRNGDARVRALQVEQRLRRSTGADRPGLDARFDVQVNQALPVAFAGTKWEVLVGLRNLFRDPTDPASVYDELLVVRPPKRVVGGVPGPLLTLRAGSRSGAHRSFTPPSF